MPLFAWPLSDLAHQLWLFVQAHGVLAVFPLVAAEEAGVPFPIPGDVWLIYIGVRISRGQISWLVATALGTLAVAAGSTTLYFVVRSFGPRLLRWLEHRPRISRLLHITPENMERAESWLRRYGASAVFIGRLIPGLRIAMTIVSATFRVPYPAFILGTTLSAFVWVNAFFLTGRLVGRVNRHSLGMLVGQLTVLRVAIAVGVLAGIWLLTLRVRRQ